MLEGSQAMQACMQPLGCLQSCSASLRPSSCNRLVQPGCQQVLCRSLRSITISWSARDLPQKHHHKLVSQTPAHCFLALACTGNGANCIMLPCLHRARWSGLHAARRISASLLSLSGRSAAAACCFCCSLAVSVGFVGMAQSGQRQLSLCAETSTPPLAQGRTQAAAG